MEFFPYFRRPYGYNRMPYYNIYNQNKNMKPRQGAVQEDKNIEFSKQRQGINDYEKEQKEKINKSQKYARIEETRSDIDRLSEPIFEIFGIKLYFDDILIVSLLFFLYNEGAEDNLLFISLILLLLS